MARALTEPPNQLSPSRSARPASKPFASFFPLPEPALVVHPASRLRLLWVWSVSQGAGPGWGGCDDPSGARVERGGRAQADADDALTKTRRGTGAARADHPARG